MRIVATLLTLGLAAGATLAADAPLKGDPAAGATKSATCTACHGVNGNSMLPEWPALAGQNAVYLRDQIARFRDGHRIDLLMMPMVQDLTDQDIADLAAYYSTQNPQGLEADPSYWQAGQTLYRVGDTARGIPACAACHGPVGRGVPAAGYPALQAQHSLYTVKQLENLAAGTRYTKDTAGRAQAGPNATMMAEIAKRLTPEDRRNVASYLQGIR
jgi:cytochrome c553